MNTAPWPIIHFNRCVATRPARALFTALLSLIVCRHLRRPVLIKSAASFGGAFGHVRQLEEMSLYNHYLRKVRFSLKTFFFN